MPTTKRDRKQHTAATASGGGPGSLDRRRFLQYVGAGATVLAGVDVGLLPLGCTRQGGTAWVAADGTPRWTPPPYPVPLPADRGTAADDRRRLSTYEVVDDLVLPHGYRYEILSEWGERLGPADDVGKQIACGYNNDYTGIVPIAGSDDEYWLFVNYEYISARPWLEGRAEDGLAPLPEIRLVRHAEDPQSRGQFSVDDWSATGDMVDLGGTEPVPAAVRTKMARLCAVMLEDLGVAVLRARRRADGGFEVIPTAGDHKRIAGASTRNIEPAVLERYRFTGPAALVLAGRRPRGTLANCSGGTTPWGTFLTCEENIQYEMAEEVGPGGEVAVTDRQLFGGRGERPLGVLDDSNPIPTNLNGIGYGMDPPLDGREYGWVCEVDPKTGLLLKHTSLGRFRHENVALRCVAGGPLVAYLGDDRRGGHVWKFVSDETVEDPTAVANSRLFERGTLYAARFADDFTGEWLPLAPSTPLRRPQPEHCALGRIRVPARPAGGTVAVGVASSSAAMDVEQWIDTVESFTGRDFADSTLGDLLTAHASTSQPKLDLERGILMLDAFAMANAAGATPTARPEDIEVHPLDQSVYIAFTDATGSGDGSPDQRIFPDSDLSSSRQYGVILRLEETDSEAAAQTFTWGRLTSSGEVAENGGGFASADNLAFDPEGNLWMVTDILTAAHNRPTDRQQDHGTAPGGIYFPGVFGNNAMFMIPTSGPQRGQPHLFALGPVESELTGPTFSDDGKTLILSIQHPGEFAATRRSDNPERRQTHIVADRDGEPFEQLRSVPIGSNFPSGELDRAPRPTVVCITRDGRETQD